MEYLFPRDSCACATDLQKCSHCLEEFQNVHPVSLKCGTGPRQFCRSSEDVVVSIEPKSTS